MHVAPIQSFLSADFLSLNFLPTFEKNTKRGEKYFSFDQTHLGSDSVLTVSSLQLRSDIFLVMFLTSTWFCIDLTSEATLVFSDWMMFNCSSKTFRFSSFERFASFNTACRARSTFKEQEKL